ncbi:MAG: phosphoenolpyruvate carboxykinase (ATP), partial [Chitinophagaceae bacterium]
KYTRAMITAVLDGKLTDTSFRKDPLFGFDVPVSCPGVPADILDPRSTWADGNAYDQKAKYLAGLFNKNFERFSNAASAETKNAIPKM